MRTDKPAKKRSRREVYVFAVLCGVSFSCLLFSTRSFVVNFRDAGFSLFSGIRIGIHSVASFAGGIVNSIQELARLRRDYAELVERMERYEIFERTSAEIRQENYRLREQLDFSLSLQYKHTVAEITGRDPDNLYQAFSVNKGKRHGVETNMSVIAYQDGIQALVGIVIQAGLFESLVMPLYSGTAYVSARFAKSRYEGLVEGQGGLEFPLRMRSITKRARSEIQEGDVVITSGLGGMYPAGITIGRVSSLYFEEALTSMEIELVPSIDFSRLEYVIIISPEDFAAHTAEDETGD
ncbi:MAG: rod shape-determining protein MreC [Spirochaetaceae bacterium]|jgi:rod shape-determining protein MreC|nr:rod shape-determining protein MreC [Spirochaetaceae bacterium]